MASFHLTASQIFPEGTEVAAYPSTNWTGGEFPHGAPQGDPVTTATITDGAAEFTGLTAALKHFAYADVGGEHRYVAFTPLVDMVPPAQYGAARYGPSLIEGDNSTFASSIGDWVAK